MSPFICPQIVIVIVACTHIVVHSFGVEAAAAVGVLLCVCVGVKISSAFGGNNRWAGSSGFEKRTDQCDIK